MKIRTLLYATVAILVVSCSEKRIVKSEDINSFLKNTGITQTRVSEKSEEIDFWEKRLSKDTGSTVDKLQLGWLYSELYKSTGNVQYLHRADSFFTICSKVNGNFDPDIYFTLSQLAVAKHSFIEAYDYVKTAETKGANKYTAALLGFDAAMELGKYSDATQKLELLKDKEAFDYLIRKSKLEDHNGDLESAIEYMENAFEKVKHLNKPSLYCWALSNLSDMYGHAGKIKQAYRGYLDVLKKDSSYLYALKGIAWIAYSHDKNVAEAERIIKYILSQTAMPDLYLLLAELEAFKGDKKSGAFWEKKFLAEIETNNFGNMYNKYLIQLYADDSAATDRALQLALSETESRTTPETFCWLAWVHHKKGNIEKATALYRNYVLNKTFEPEAMFYGGHIMKAAGQKELAKKLFSECLNSSFELGPLLYQQVRKQLADL